MLICANLLFYFISPVGSSQAVLLSTPLDEFTLMDKLDVSGAIKVGRSEEVIKLGPQLLRIIQNRNNWDIMIFVGSYKFRCHMLALQMYSPYFRRFKTSQTYAIRMPSKWVTPQAFKIVYEWIMQEESIKLMSFSNRSILEIYSAAQFLGITDLINTVCQSFDMIKNEDEIYSLLPDVFHLGIPIFEQLFLSRISRFFLTLVASQEFVEMKARHVILLLASQSIGVNCEIEVGLILALWLPLTTHSFPSRLSMLPCAGSTMNGHSVASMCTIWWALFGSPSYHPCFCATCRDRKRHECCMRSAGVRWSSRRSTRPLCKSINCLEIMHILTVNPPAPTATPPQHCSTRVRMLY